MEVFRAQHIAATALPGSVSSSGRYQLEAAVSNASWGMGGFGNSALGMQVVPEEQHRVGSMQQYKSAISQPEDHTFLTIHREIRCLEDKITRQLLRLQDQNQRVVDMMLEPLDAKVAGLENKLKGTDILVAELAGGLRGLQDAMQTQVQRTDSSEVRSQRWRKSFEADLLTRLSSLENGTAAKTQEMVTHTDLADVAGLMKQELRKLVQEAFSRNADFAPTHEDLNSVALELRQELRAVQAESGREELAAVADALRSELRRLSEASLSDAVSGVAGRNGSLEVHSKGLDELIERATLSKAAMEEASSDIRCLRDDLRSRGLLGGSGPWSQPPLSREEVQLIAEQACRETRGLGAEEIGFVVRELEERVADATARLEALAAESTNSRSMSETLVVVQDTTNMRLEAMEQRQCCLRDEVRGLSGKDGDLDRTRQAVEDHGLRHAVDVQHIGQLAQRVGELERVGLPEQIEVLVRRLRSLELAPNAGEELRSRLEVLERRAPADLIRRIEAIEKKSLRLGDSAVPTTLAVPSSLQEVTVLAEGLARDLCLARGAADGAPEAALGNVAQQSIVSLQCGGGVATPSSEADIDVHSQLAAIWSALAELADLSGVKVNSPAGLPAVCDGSIVKAESATQVAVVSAAGTDTQATVVTATAAATEAMIGAVRDAIVAVSECRRDADSWQRTVSTMAEEVVDLRGEWSQMRNRVSTCEKGLGDLKSKAVSISAGAVQDGADPIKGGAVANADGKDHRGSFTMEARPTVSPRTPPTCDPETLHPRRTNSPANGGDIPGFGGALEEATEKVQA